MIFGLYNTGTNRMQSLLHALYPSASICPDTKSHWGPKTCKSRGPSKHGHPERVRSFLEDPSNAHRHVVLMVRDPFANLISTLREGYQLNRCIREGTHDWINKRCKCSIIHRPDPLCAHGQSSYSSVVAIWNTYTAGALELSKTQWPRRIGKILLVRYEDFFQYPEATMQKINRVFGLPEPASDVDIFAVLDKPAKAHDIPYTKRVQSVQSKGYLTSYSQEEMHSICARLDVAGVEELGYGGECADVH